MTRMMKGWDAYVSEARMDPLLLPLPDGGQLTIAQPTGKALRGLGPLMARNDLEGIVHLLLGEDNGRRVLDLVEDAPINVLPRLISDVMAGFGLDAAGPMAGVGAAGESQASSN